MGTTSIFLVAMLFRFQAIMWDFNELTRRLQSLSYPNHVIVKHGAYDFRRSKKANTSD